MTKHSKLILGLTLIFAVGGCATKARVMTLENGVFKSTARDSDRNAAEDAAVSAAEKHCGSQGKKAVFVNDSTQAAGASEAQKNVAKASRAAQVLNQNRAATRAASGHTSVAPSVEHFGQVGEIFASDRAEYVSEMRFRCD